MILTVGALVWTAAEFITPAGTQATPVSVRAAPRQFGSAYGAAGPDIETGSPLPRTRPTDQAMRDAPPRPILSEFEPPIEEAPRARLLGTLVGREHQVEVYIRGELSLYSVIDAEGVVLAELITADEFADRFPEIDVTEFEPLIADDGGAHADEPR